VIGPDEYHEPVDDNAFTNVMARWNLRRAVRLTEGGTGGAGHRRIELEEGPDTLPLSPNQAGAAEPGEVVADGGLLEVEDGREVADAHWGGGVLEHV